jgi:hypothetical protein
MATLQPMDFIERYLGFFPDHVGRPFEALVLIAVVAMIAVLARQILHHLRD